MLDNLELEDTQSIDVYQYRDYVETLLTYGADAASYHLTKDFWYIDNGYLQACDKTKAESTNKVFVPRWDRIK